MERTVVVVSAMAIVTGCGGSAVTSTAGPDGAGGDDTASLAGAGGDGTTSLVGAGGGDADEVPSCPDAGAFLDVTCQGFEGCEAAAWEGDQATLCNNAQFRSEEIYPFTLENPDAAQCILQALRDGDEGAVTWSVTGPLTGQYGSSFTLNLLPGGVALLSNYNAFDLSTSTSMRGPITLRDSDHFAACLTQSHPDAIWDCLSAYEESCGI